MLIIFYKCEANKITGLYVIVMVIPVMYYRLPSQSEMLPWIIIVRSVHLAFLILLEFFLNIFGGISLCSMSQLNMKMWLWLFDWLSFPFSRIVQELMWFITMHMIQWRLWLLRLIYEWAVKVCTCVNLTSIS